MLGWEFPPHISGGLGTACHGLTRGLAAVGVEVVFVVPRALGDEDADHMELVGANRVRVRRWTEGGAAAVGGAAARGGAGDALRAAEAAGATTLADALRSELGRTASTSPAAADGSASAVGAPELAAAIAVDSLLRPYMAEDSFGSPPEHLRAELGPWLERLGFAHLPADAEGWRRLSEAIAARAKGPHTAPSFPKGAASAEGANAGVRAESGDPEGEPLTFTGQYGAGLLDEVARYALAVAEIARREHFDLIHAHDWITYPAAAAAKAVSGKPLVCHVHALEYDRSGENPNPRVKAIEQLGLDIADLLICVSHYTAGVLERRYRVERAKLRVVHNAVTQQEQRSALHVTRHLFDPVVLFLGRVTFQKGPDYFLEAAARVVRLRPDVRFVLSGSGDMLPAMIDRSARLGLGRNMFFTGFLRGADVERMYSLADLFVMPSVSEPFGITPLEAMALDVPVIVSRQSGVSEILTNALKVDFWDVDELANKILAVVEYRPLRDHLVESGREEVRRMRWEQRAQRVREVYEELLRARLSG